MSYDFFTGQLRLALVAFLAFASGKGWLSPADAGAVTAIAAPLAAIILPVLWSWSANWRRKLVPVESVAVHADDVHVNPITGDVATTEKMMRVVGAWLIAFIILLPFIAPCFAADITTKAVPLPVDSPVPTCSVAGCSGFFLGAEVGGSGTGVNVLNIGALNADGTYMGGNAGYQFYNGSWWLGVRADVSYAVANPPANVIPGLSNKLFSFEGVEVGGNLSNLAGLFNNGAVPINLPGPIANAVPTMLIGACQNGRHLSGYCAGAAVHFFIPNSKFTVDAMYLNAQYGTSNIAPNATANTENRGTLGFSYHF